MADESQPEELEQDSRFPSGPWRGFFVYPNLPKRHWMDLELTFRGGSMRGSGHDWVGKFLIHGKYETSSGKCWWAKRYIGKHDVAYDGYNEGKGIWGRWQIPPTWHGGFHIWPLAMRDPTINELKAEVEVPQTELVTTASEEPL